MPIRLAISLPGPFVYMSEPRRRLVRRVPLSEQGKLGTTLAALGFLAAFLALPFAIGCYTVGWLATTVLYVFGLTIAIAWAVKPR